MSWLRKTVPICVALGATLGCLMGAQQMREHAQELANVNAPASSSDRDWNTYDGDVSGNHYSPLAQINRTNVRNLKTAWIYNTGERGGLQTNPLIVDRVMYAYTPSQKIVALNAVTGKLIWNFDSGIRTEQPNRGMSYWTDGKDSRLLPSPITSMLWTQRRAGQSAVLEKMGPSICARTWGAPTTPKSSPR
jgi:glucose dehydrogenase